MDNDEPIVKPVRGKNSPQLGPVAVMAAPKPDLQPLAASLGMENTKPAPLFTGNLFAGDGPAAGYSLAGPFLGSPHAAMLMEVLASRGAEKVIFQGWCGSLNAGVRIGDIVVPTGGIVDEGTSPHYGVGAGEISRPSEALRNALCGVLHDEALPFHEGVVWTTDGAFRETPAKVACYQRKKALAVEMEMSCIFSVAASLGIDAGGLLVVSDELFAMQWKPGFKSEAFKRGRMSAAGVVGKLCKLL
ncbi:MAG: nucleoside phosphorylase [Deltaproteobacteria bacterium]|nr:nucleoside phosphorylase [Deltaproteobacteria bacterium]